MGYSLDRTTGGPADELMLGRALSKEKAHREFLEQCPWKNSKDQCGWRQKGRSSGRKQLGPGPVGPVGCSVDFVLGGAGSH